MTTTVRVEPSFDALPDDIYVVMFGFLGIRERARVAQVLVTASRSASPLLTDLLSPLPSASRLVFPRCCLPLGLLLSL